MIKAEFGRNAIRICAVAGGIALSALSPAKAETLADALVGAYNHSGLLDQNRALLRAADEDVATSLAAVRPILSWQADLNHTIGNSANAASGGTSVDINTTTLGIALVMDYQLYDFGADAFRTESAKETVLATRAALLSLEQQVLLRAVSAFMNVRRAGENVALRQNNVRLLTQELRAARDRLDVGEVNRTDVALAEASLAEARSGLAAAQGAPVAAHEPVSYTHLTLPQNREE